MREIIVRRGEGDCGDTSGSNVGIIRDFVHECKMVTAYNNRSGAIFRRRYLYSYFDKTRSSRKEVIHPWVNALKDILKA